jgi:uncharacterized protein YoxC
MSNENSGNGGKIIISLLAIALIGSWIYFSTSKTEIISNYTAQVNNLDSAKNVLQADFIAVSAKADSLTQQNTALQGDLLSKSKDIQPVKASQVDTAQADKRTAAEAAAWSQTYKGRQAQKAYAIANGIKTGTTNPSWREEAREHHRKNFGKTAPAGDAGNNLPAGFVPVPQ